MATRRIERVNSEIKKVVSNIIVFKLNNEVVLNNMVSVLDVSTSADFSTAKIFISVFPKEKENDVLNALKVCVPFIRKEIAKEINLRIVPAIYFEIDKTQEKVEHLEELFKQIKKED